MPRAGPAGYDGLDELDEQHFAPNESLLPDQSLEADEDFANLEPPDLPEATQPRPTLVQYQECWDEKLKLHTRETPGDFSRDIIVESA